MPVSTVTLQYRPGVPLAVIRRRASPAELSRVVPDSCGAVWRALRAQGLRGGRNVALYWDDAIQVEAGVEFDGAFAEQDGVTRSSTPPGQVATFTHLGPYGTLGSAHELLHRWLRERGHRALGPRWEIYGHWQAAWDTDPSQVTTEVCCLVAPGGDEGA